MKQNKLTRLAKGQECTVRLPGICNFNPDTTVFAHLRMNGISGMGMKAPPILGAWACSDCHDAIDRRRFMHLDREYVRLAHFEGMARTVARLFLEGVIKV